MAECETSTDWVFMGFDEDLNRSDENRGARNREFLA